MSEKEVDERIERLKTELEEAIVESSQYKVPFKVGDRIEKYGHEAVVTRTGLCEEKGWCFWYKDKDIDFCQKEHSVSALSWESWSLLDDGFLSNLT